jgi:hypothetical protein
MMDGADQVEDGQHPGENEHPTELPDQRRPLHRQKDGLRRQPRRAESQSEPAQPAHGPKLIQQFQTESRRVGGEKTDEGDAIQHRRFRPPRSEEGIRCTIVPKSLRGLSGTALRFTDIPEHGGVRPRHGRDSVEYQLNLIGEGFTQARALALIPVVGFVEFRAGFRTEDDGQIHRCHLARASARTTGRFWRPGSVYTTAREEPSKREMVRRPAVGRSIGRGDHVGHMLDGCIFGI